MFRKRVPFSLNGKLKTSEKVNFRRSSLPSQQHSYKFIGWGEEDK